MALEIIFNEDDIDAKNYPEALIVGGCSIVLITETNVVYLGKNAKEVVVFIDGKHHTYCNVMMVQPYYFEED